MERTNTNMRGGKIAPWLSIIERAGADATKITVLPRKEIEFPLSDILRKMKVLLSGDAALMKVYATSHREYLNSVSTFHPQRDL